MYCVPVYKVALIALSMSFLPIDRARADDIRPCSPPTGATEVAYETDVPPGLRTALARDVGDIVLAGAPFDATDVVVTGRHRRLIFVWHRGSRWIVATERGGRGYSAPVFAYDVSPDGSAATPVARRIAFPSTVCATALALLTVPPQQSGH